jgi:multicomponent Na+:H+ antiporter subunit A
MFLGAEAKVAIAAAMTFLLVHALYKSALFLVVGIVDHEAGARDLTQVRGLARAMPVTAFAAGVAALSMAGFPPFLGFIGKELQYEGALAVADAPALIVAASVAANAMMVAVAGLLTIRVFFGPLQARAEQPHEAPLRMWLGPVLLASLGLILGVSPGLTESALVQPAVMAVLREPVTVELELWHGVNLPLVLSLLTVALGVAVYAWHGSICAGLARLEARLPITADRLYERALAGLNRLAEVQTAVLQSGSLVRYLTIVLGTFVLGVGGTLLLEGGLAAPSAWASPPPHDWAVLGLIAAGTVVTLATGSRLAAICALGVVSAGVGLLFLLYGAPDVAMTQLLVDTLFIVLATFVLVRLPTFKPVHVARSRQLLHAGLALAAGATTTALLLGVIAGPFDRRITDFFEAHSYPEAHGRNIVNVILVDFRVLDTFGETTVVVIAALAAYALLKLRRAPEGPS